jgi:hypothetical protein
LYQDRLGTNTGKVQKKEMRFPYCCRAGGAPDLLQKLRELPRWYGNASFPAI